MFAHEMFWLTYVLCVFTETPACKLKNFDLNDTCNDVEGFEDGLNCPSWIRQDSTQSPPQTSGNSDSTSAQSLSSSNGDAQVYHFSPFSVLINEI
jgi:hypothetical protein